MATTNKEVETREELPDASGRGEDVVLPALVHVFAVDRPVSDVFPLTQGRVLVLGRSAECDVSLDDELLSRKHTRIAFDRDDFVVTDLDSRNGTYFDAQPIDADHGARSGVLRIGGSVFLLVRDSRRFTRARVINDRGTILGPTMQVVRDVVTNAAASGQHVLITGESGVGKEYAAGLFHKMGPSSRGPQVTVNCGALPAALAESELFGVRKGAFSGADIDRDGYFVAANGGTLVLDEVGLLDERVQGKLLRALQTKTIHPLGAVAPRTVDVSICASTNADLRAEVSRGTFRADLFARLAQVEIAIPPLRERREEIPWLIEAAITAHATARRDGARVTLLPATARFVEACLLHPWSPMNIRDLMTHVRRAYQRALDARDIAVRLEHLELPATAGAATSHTSSPPTSSSSETVLSPREAELARFKKAYEDNNCDVKAAMAATGIKRSAAYRMLDTLRGKKQR